MTKISTSLPDGHGLVAIRDQLLDDPRKRHVTIAIVNCSKETRDYDKHTREPVAAVRTIEVVHPDDLDLTHKILTRARDRRIGATVLPLNVEDEISSVFKVRSEDIGTDLQSDTAHLTDEQVKKLATSLDRPLRHELTQAIAALRDSRQWVELGRARRVLQLVVRKLEDNDKRLLRDADGNLVDPETGEIVDEEKLTTEDLDRMLEAYFDQMLDDDGQDELPLDDQADDAGEDELADESDDDGEPDPQT